MKLDLQPYAIEIITIRLIKNLLEFYQQVCFISGRRILWTIKGINSLGLDFGLLNLKDLRSLSNNSPLTPSKFLIFLRFKKHFVHRLVFDPFFGSFSAHFQCINFVLGFESLPAQKRSKNGPHPIPFGDANVFPGTHFIHCKINCFVWNLVFHVKT